MSMNPKTARYASWKSPITSDLIVTQAIGLSEVRFDGQAVYWLGHRSRRVRPYLLPMPALWIDAAIVFVMVLRSPMSIVPQGFN